MQRGALLQQVELLEDHAHGAARLQQLLFGKRPQLLPVHRDRTLGRLFQKIDAPHQRGFARAGQADDAKYLAASDVQADTVKRHNRTRAPAERLVQVLDSHNNILFQTLFPLVSK